MQNTKPQDQIHLLDDERAGRTLCGKYLKDIGGRESSIPLRPFYKSIAIACSPKGAGDLSEKLKQQLAAFIWMEACRSESDQYVQEMRKIILQRFPTICLQSKEDIRAQRPMTREHLAVWDD
jgi:hypothetical protein